MNTMTFLTRIFSLFAVVMSISTAVFAQTILTVEVRIPGEPEKTVEFSQEGLQALGLHTLVTENDYVDGIGRFEGPLVRSLLAAVGAQNAKHVLMIAENDYDVKIPVAEFFTYNVVLALKLDDVRMSLRDKGPIWLMYPISDHEELQQPRTNGRLIWQLGKIEIE